jgi:hypothetical protein
MSILFNTERTENYEFHRDFVYLCLLRELCVKNNIILQKTILK